MYQTLLFDLDGTLTDPAVGITNAVMYALDQWDIHVTDRRALYRFIGPPLKDSFMEYYGFSEVDADRALEAYRTYFREKGKFENTVYPGIEDLLRALREAGMTLAVATSKPEAFAREILEHFGLAPCFSVIAGAAMDGTRSRKDDVVLCALERLGWPRHHDTVMIGDRRHDILGAPACFLDSIGVLYGFGDRAEMVDACATHIVETVDDLRDLLFSPERIHAARVTIPLEHVLRVTSDSLIYRAPDGTERTASLTTAAARFARIHDPQGVDTPVSYRGVGSRFFSERSGGYYDLCTDPPLRITLDISLNRPQKCLSRLGLRMTGRHFAAYYSLQKQLAAQGFATIDMT